MKIKDLLKDNKEYLVNQEKSLTQRLHTYQVEADKIATELKETQKQIKLIDKVSNFVDTIPNGSGNSNQGGGK